MTQLISLLRKAAFAATQEPVLVLSHMGSEGDVFADLTYQARIDYFMDILNSPYPAHFFLFLCKNKALTPYFSILSEADTIPAGPQQYHSGSVLEHMACCMNAVAGDALAVWMSLCHDLGKCATSKDILPRHIGHEERGEQLALELGERIGLPENFIRAGSLAAKLHMRAGNYGKLRPGTRRDLIITIQNANIWSSFWKLIDADRGETVSMLAKKDARIINTIPKEKLTDAAWRDAQCRILAKSAPR